ITENADEVAAADGANILVVGTRSATGMGLNVWIRKLDAAGAAPAVLWTVTLSGPGNRDDYGNALAVDRQTGSFYVGGAFTVSVSGTSSTVYAFVAQFGPDGQTVVWTRSWIGTNRSNLSLSNGIYGLAVDSGGNVVGTGIIRNADDDILVVRLLPDGTPTAGFPKQVNAGTIAPPANDAGYGVAVNAGGEIFVAGKARNTGTLDDIWVNKYLPAGSAAWGAPRVIGTTANDSAQALALDACGNVIVAGYVGTTLNDAWLAKLDPIGVPVWTRTITAGASVERFDAVAVDPSGLIYAAGQVTGNDIRVAKYSQDATVTVWVDTYNGGSVDSGFGLAWVSGTLFAAGMYQPVVNNQGMWLRKYEAPAQPDLAKALDPANQCTAPRAAARGGLGWRPTPSPSSPGPPRCRGRLRSA
ncbi:MAG: hypothetical protein AAB368_02930, partial [bacterium]